ncbi:MAG: pirin family protein [Burkholderiaceae bacterium]|nr:pirin family protein [Burkholderiaceae bacterium]
MLTVRKSEERGHANHGWLDSRHSFSFADYYDPRFMGWGNLRVINEDRIRPGTGFGRHGHRDMEIISYVKRGALSHRDSMGNEHIIVPGDVQRMSAGTGVQHSEFDHSTEEGTHFFQIWITPAQKGIAPGYEQKRFTDAEKQGRLRLIASPDGAQQSLTLHADARLFAGLLQPGQATALDLAPGRKAYVHVVEGRVTACGQPLAEGDAAMLQAEARIALQADTNAEVLVFDLAG